MAQPREAIGHPPPNWRSAIQQDLGRECTHDDQGENGNVQLYSRQNSNI